MAETCRHASVTKNVWSSRQVWQCNIFRSWFSQSVLSFIFIMILFLLGDKQETISSNIAKFVICVFINYFRYFKGKCDFVGVFSQNRELCSANIKYTIFKQCVLCVVSYLVHPGNDQLFADQLFLCPGPLWLMKMKLVVKMLTV